MLTARARVTTPPLKSARYAVRSNPCGTSTRPPASAICSRGATDVENTDMNGMITSRQRTPRMTALIDLSLRPALLCPRTMDLLLIRGIHSCLSEHVGELVRAQDEQHADHALHQTHSGRHAPVPADHAAVVDVGVQHLRPVKPHRVLLEQDLFESHRE